MLNRNSPNTQYPHNICEAFTDYIDAGHPLYMRSDHVGTTLEITFAIKNPEAYHRLLEGKPTPTTTHTRTP